LLLEIFVGYVPLILIFILNFQIFNVARKQRKRIMAETTVTVNISSEPVQKTDWHRPSSRRFQSSKDICYRFRSVNILCPYSNCG
jgi:hypothetical protein